MKKLLLFILLSPLSLFATNYYISTSGSDGATGLVGFPKATLTSVFSTYNLASGDIIYVAAGTYGEKNITIGSDDEGFTIQGADLDAAGLPTSIFNSNQSGVWLIFGDNNNDNITIDKIKVKDYKSNLNSPNGGGIYVNNYDCTGITISNCYFDNCDAGAGSKGGAIYFLRNVVGSSNIWNLTNTTFTNCDAPAGGGAVYIQSGSEIDLNVSKCKFYNNSSSAALGSVLYYDGPSGSVLTMTNSLVYKNTLSGNNHGTIYIGSAGCIANLMNCTIADNTANSSYTGGVYFEAGGSTVTNCVLYGNTYKDVYRAAGTINVNYCCYQNQLGCTVTNSITTTPGFKNTVSNDYSLATTSGCIDKATATGAPSDDILSVMRPMGIGVDIGAFESNSCSFTLTSAVGTNAQSICLGSAITNITYVTAITTGISNSGVDGANGLPVGVSASWSGNVITISGSPSVLGIYNYSIPLTGCSGEVVTGTIVVSTAPSVSNAGVDITQCNTPTFTMSANTPTTGSGLWTRVSGTVGTITTPTSPTTTITGMTAGQTSTFRWTLTNGACTSSDDVIIKNDALPTTSSAGTDITNCIGSFTLAGNNPTTGTGLWSVVSGTATITTPSLRTSTVTGVIQGSSATLRWTTTNGTCSSTDDVILTYSAAPTTSNAGVDITQCTTTTFTMSANTPTTGTGLWTRVSGTVGTITTTTSPTTTITGLTAGQTATFRWTITNGTCTSSTDDVILTNSAAPTPVNAGTDINNCTGSFTMGATAPTTGTGVWSLFSGSASITTLNSRTSAVTGVSQGSSATLRWTVTNGACSATDDVVITYDPAPTTSNAGLDISQCTTTTFTMSANTPTTGTGLWTRVSGTVGTITTPTSPTTTITGMTAGQTSTFRWTITNGTCTSTDDVIITNYVIPTPVNAGTDINNCTGSFTMNATAPTTGTGVWSLFSGTATITTPSSRTSAVTGVSQGSSATLRWTVTNGACSATDDVVITYDVAPTTSNAGLDISQCTTTTFTMSANTPTTGTGLWTRVSGTVGAITTPNSPTTTITGMTAGQTATFRWTITNGTCISTDDVIITNYAAPTPVNAGTDINSCTGSVTMAATAPTTGTGVWSLFSGTATITTPSSITSTVTGVSQGSSATLRWTVTNGTCSATDDVVITYDAALTTSNAGLDISQCTTTTFTMSANTPTTGTGLWTRVSGTVGTITTPTSPITTITGMTDGQTATFRWTITNGACTSTDDVIITNYAAPTPVNAGADINNCTGSFTMAATAPTAGTGVWSLFSGTATITTPSSRTSIVTGVSQGSSATLRWTVTNGTCSATDDVVITYDAALTTSNAGLDISQCTTTTFTMSANTPTAGTGLWTRVSGTVGTITTPTSPTTTITGMTAGQTSTFRWTITNGTCTSTDDVILTNYVIPTTSNASTDQSNCTGSFTLAGNSPATGTGVWSVVSGTATITTPSLRTSTVTSIPAASSATLRWTITNGTCSSTDDVVLTNNTPTVSTAGSDISQCANSTFTMAANTPTTGTGAWSLVSGTATITTASSATTTVTGLAVGTSATLRWTITNGSCTTTDDVFITNNTSPSAPSAGSVTQPTCTVATGAFQIAGYDANRTYTFTPSVVSISATGLVTANAGTYVFTVDNAAGCTSIASTNIVVNTQPALQTAPAVLTTQPTCSFATGSVIVTSPANGTGITYTLTGTIPVVSAVTNSTGNFSTLSSGTYALTTTNASNCTSSATTITITAQPASPTANSGSPLIAICQSATSTAMGGSIGGSSTSGTWSGGLGTWSNANDPSNATYKAGVSESGLITLTLTASSPGCGEVIVTKTITVNSLPTISPIMGKTNICLGDVTALTNSTTSGVWSSSNLAVASVNAFGLVTSISSGATQLIYTVSLNGCSNNAFTTINVNSLPVISSIVGTSSICLGSTSQLSNATLNGTWSSSNPLVASVNATGLVNAISLGTSTISYSVTTNGCTTTKSIDITTSENKKLNLKQGVVTVNSVDFTWDAMNDVSYNYSYKLNASNSSITGTLPMGTTSYSVKNLNPGDSIYFTLQPSSTSVKCINQESVKGGTIKCINPFIKLYQVDTTLCLGAKFSFKSEVGNLNQKLNYTWFINGTQVLNDSSLFSIQSIQKNDKISVKVIGNNVCANNTEVFAKIYDLQLSILVPDMVLASVDSLVLKGNPIGGVFSGPGVVKNKLAVKSAGLGSKKINYNYNNTLNNCKGQVTKNVMIYDTVFTCKSTIFDTVKVTKYDTVKVTKNVTKYDTVKVAVSDTVSILKVKFKLTTGIKANQETTMRVYPNPTSDILRIEVADEKAMAGYIYKIIDATGKEVYNQPVKAIVTDIPLKTLGAVGAYFLEVHDENFKMVVSKKIILE